MREASNESSLDGAGAKPTGQGTAHQPATVQGAAADDPSRNPSRQAVGEAAPRDPAGEAAPRTPAGEAAQPAPTGEPTGPMRDAPPVTQPAPGTDAPRKRARYPSRNLPRQLLRGSLSLSRWRTRLVLWGAAAFAGLVVVGFAKLADHALALFFALHARHAWLPLLLAPPVGMLTVWLTRRYFAGSQGSGIPQVIAATRLAGHGRAVGHLVSLRIALGKIGLGAFALTGGFSAGREGPSVQVAASIMHFAHRLLPNARAIRASDLILAGGAAGVAAAFNTPLAGIVFAIEELGKRLESRTSGVLVSTIIVSGLVSIALLGNYNYFGHMNVGEVTRRIAVPVLFYGLACGLAGGLFARLLLWPQRNPQAALWRWRTAHPVWFAGACGLIVAALGFFGGGSSYGSGYGVTSRLVSGDLASSGLPWHAPFTRYFATVFTYFSGIPGGIFAPSLAVGAAIGATTAPWIALTYTFNPAHGMGAEHVQIIALCMAGFLAAVTQSPVTAAIIVMEMIDGHGMVISLMAVALLASAVSARLSRELYQQLAVGFLADERAQESAGRDQPGEAAAPPGETPGRNG
jgi:H+/Cl- antiporter ClcA